MVEYILYKGEKLPIRVSYYVLMMAQKESGLKLNELDTNLEAQQLILWYALIAGHKMADKELTVKKEDCVWILDESYMDFQKAMMSFAQQLVDLQQELVKEGDKKK